MGNTVLTYLRKMKHPDMVRRVNASTLQNWYSHWSAGQTVMLIRRNNSKIIITMNFKLRHEIYDFTIYRDFFYAYRRRSENYKTPYGMPFAMKVVAELEGLPYAELEAAMFQQSLLSDFGMFGAQEADVLLKLRNIYFGESK